MTLTRHTGLTPSSLQRGAGLTRRTPLQPGGSWARTVPLRAARRTGSSSGKLTPPAPGEFTAAVKLLVRKRAGQGDIFEAACEACGCGLGEKGGQVQHIVGRGMGGCRDEVINSTANAALLCGTPYEGCHGKATAFDEEMGKRGFWLPRGTDPRLAPMMVIGERGSRRRMWRSMDGRYLLAAPELAA